MVWEVCSVFEAIESCGRNSRKLDFHEGIIEGCHAAIAGLCSCCAWGSGGLDH